MFGAYNQLGLDALETLTEKPFGDTDIDHAISVMDKTITVVGNIDQIEFLRTATPEEIREAVRRLLDKFKKRRKFILGTSDYISEGTSYENIKAFHDAGREFGEY
jgi:uroporphyrinogen-III decarboxylase